MGLFALLLVAAAAWLIWTGRLQRMTTMDGIMLGLSIVGAIMAARGRPIMGGIPLAVSMIYAARSFRISKRKRSAPIRNTTQRAAIAEASELLGLQPDANEQAIRAAHRRLIAKNHPDAGGTQALAEQINRARDILLRHATERSGSHSEP